jgi:hypothetical protein
MFVTFSQYMVMSLMNLSCTSIRGLDIPSMRGEQKSLHSEYKERGGVSVVLPGAQITSRPRRNTYCIQSTLTVPEIGLV